MKTFLFALTLALLSGCATSWDVKLNNSDNDAIKNGQNASSNIVYSKTNAIQSIGLEGSNDPVAVALFQVMKAQAIATIETPMFEVKKARLNTDNVPEVMETIRQGVPIWGTVRVATTAIKNDRGTTVLQSEGGDINMQDSLNRTEVHATAIDGSTAETSNTGDTTTTTGM